MLRSKCEDKISDITNLSTNTTLNAKINEVKNEIPSITNLPTTPALNAKINEMKNKIPNITTSLLLLLLLILKTKYLTIVNISLLQNLIS